MTELNELLQNIFKFENILLLPILSCDFYTDVSPKFCSGVKRDISLRHSGFEERNLYFSKA